MELTPRPAATVMLLRETSDGGFEVYMARRSSRSAFMPDAYVFPGGAVDAADADPRALLRLDAAPRGIEPEFAIAALRELVEEVGVLMAVDDDGKSPPRSVVAEVRTSLVSGTAFVDALERFDLRLLGSALAYYSRWVTPVAETTRRFDARFFLARAPHDQVAAADAVEMHDGLWIAPAQALERGARGEWTLVFPTVRHLERLASFAKLDDLFAHAASREPVPVMPNVETNGEIRLPAEMEAW